jgi:hypothetical protein
MHEGYQARPVNNFSKRLTPLRGLGVFFDCYLGLTPQALC